MVLLGQPDVARPVEDALDADAPLGAREWPAGARVGAPPERDVVLRVRTVDAELGRALEASRIPVRGAVEQHHRRARLRCRTPPTVAARRARRKSAFTGLSMRSASSMKFGDAVAVLAQLVLELRVLGEVLQRGGEEPGGRLLTGGEEEGRDAHDRGDVGRRPVGVLGEREVGEDVGARLAAAVLDVGREPVVEPARGR